MNVKYKESFYLTLIMSIVAILLTLISYVIWRNTYISIMLCVGCFAIRGISTTWLSTNRNHPVLFGIVEGAMAFVAIRLVSLLAFF